MPCAACSSVSRASAPRARRRRSSPKHPPSAARCRIARCKITPVPRTPAFRPTPAFAARILDTLELAHPEARCALNYRNAFELSVATILSAQCTDERVNMVTPRLFERYPDAASLARAAPPELEQIIRSTGFFRAKAKSLIGFAKGLVEKHASEVPRTMAELVPLPGIGRKTANVVLGHAYDVNEGVAVDTHVR